jgi:hypothetical protein
MKLLNHKKGMHMGMGMSKGLNVIVGLIALATGGATTVTALQIRNLPIVPEIIIFIACALGGIILLLDAMLGVQTMSGSGFLRKGIVGFLGLVVLTAGLLPLLSLFGILSIGTIPSVVVAIICGIGGLVLIMNGLLGVRTY